MILFPRDTTQDVHAKAHVRGALHVKHGIVDDQPTENHIILHRDQQGSRGPVCVLVAVLQALNRAAGLSWAKVADQLSATGHRTRTGGRWTRQGAHQVHRARERDDQAAA